MTLAPHPLAVHREPALGSPPIALRMCPKWTLGLAPHSVVSMKHTYYRDQAPTFTEQQTQPTSDSFPRCRVVNYKTSVCVL